MAAASPPSVAARSSSDRRRIVRLRLFVASSFIFGLVTLGRGDATERQALWQVVRACIADYLTTGASFPCLAVNLSDGIDRGSVVLRPPFGAPDTILAPTRKVVGVEDPWLQTPAAPNYFAAALRASAFVKKPDGSAPRLDEVALAVNSRFTRTQDQLHIHIGCASRRVREALPALAASMKVGEWVRVHSLVPGSELWGMRTGRSDLDQLEPFRLAARRLAIENSDLNRLMVFVIGTQAANRDELVLLVADYRRQARSGQFLAEEVVDPGCLASEDSPAGR
jgi:CDP-diacylglycerol pyrophosphatase